jgi:archaellum component FlaC
MISIPETKDKTSLKEILLLTKQYSVLEQRVVQVEKDVNTLSDQYKANIRIVIKSLITIVTGVVTAIAVTHIKIS